MSRKAQEGLFATGLRFTSIIFIIVGILALLVIAAWLPETQTALGQWGDALKVVGKYVFGVNENLTTQYVTGAGTLTSAAVVITAIMLWIIIFVAFGDIIETFGALSKAVSWIIAFALGVIAALTGFIGYGVIWLTTAFLWAGAAATFLGLLAAFIVFIIVNLGSSKLSAWAARRRAGILAARATAGTTQTRAAVRGLKEIATELER